MFNRLVRWRICLGHDLFLNGAKSVLVFIVFIGIGILPMLLFLAPSTFAAAGAATGSGGGTTIDLKDLNLLAPCDKLDCLLQKIVSGILKLAPPVVAIMVLIGGYQIVTSGGDPKKLQNGKQTVLWATIGFAIIIIAQGVALLIQDILS